MFRRERSGWVDASRGLRLASGAGGALLGAIILTASQYQNAAAQSAAQLLLAPVADTVPDGEARFDPSKPQSPRNGQAKFQKSVPPVSEAAPSRIGKMPSWSVPAASGAASSGFDSLNRKNRPHDGNAISPLQLQQKNARKSSRPLTSAAPPAMRGPRPPVSASVMGTAQGQPARRRLKADEDPFAAVGFYAGTLLVKPAIEIYGGFDSNPGRIHARKSSGFYKIAPELVAKSDWERHEFAIDLRGSFTGYGHDFPPPKPLDCGCGTFTYLASPIPLNLDRPDFTGKASGRVDVTRNTKINLESRLRVSTDNPGSPDIQAGLARYPLTTSYGGSLGATQTFNRLDLTLTGTADRATYQDSTLTNGVRVVNEDRNYNQYGASLRAAYELTPGIKPFVEGAFDQRHHDISVDRSGIRRDSHGKTLRAGSTFELTRKLTGEISAGMQTRDYDDPSLRRLTGMLVDASLVWAATPLTNVKLLAKSSVNESTQANVSGVIAREYGVEVNHDLRRWLTLTGKFGVTNSLYQGSTREDNSYAASAAFVYKLTRTTQVKGEARREWLKSSINGSDYTANVFTLGLRFQR